MEVLWKFGMKVVQLFAAGGCFGMAID